MSDFSVHSFLTTKRNQELNTYSCYAFVLVILLFDFMLGWLCYGVHMQHIQYIFYHGISLCSK